MRGYGAVGDRRLKERPGRNLGPVWPLAFELATLGTPVGVIVARLSEGVSVAVTVDDAGELFELRRMVVHRRVVRWCLNRHLRIFHSLSGLVDAMQSGRVLGFLHGRLLEVTRRGVRPVIPFPFDCSLPSEASRPGVPALSIFDALGPEVARRYALAQLVDDEGEDDDSPAA